jgi:hypothetical protein
MQDTSQHYYNCKRHTSAATGQTKLQDVWCAGAGCSHCMEASAGKCKAGYPVEPFYSESCRYLQDEIRSGVCWPVGWRPQEADALHAAATVPSGCKGYLRLQGVPQAARGTSGCKGYLRLQGVPQAVPCKLVRRPPVLWLMDVAALWMFLPAVLTAVTCNWKANMRCLMLPCTCTPAHNPTQAPCTQAASASAHSHPKYTQGCW